MTDLSTDSRLRQAVADVLDFRQMRRRLWKWRIAALVLLVLLLAVLAERAPDTPSEAHIARYEISGGIADDPARDQLLADLAKDENAKGLILRINSPGGTVAGSEALYESLRLVAAQKPVVAVMSEMAASGGYMAAIGADYIIARRNTLTASVGVIFMAPNFAGAMEKVGVSMMEIRSGARKAEPTPFKPLDPAIRAAEEETVKEAAKWFIELVAERRKLSAEAREIISDGRVVLGHEAKALGLIDEIGGEEQALAWLTEKGIDSNLPVEDWALPEPPIPLIDRLLGKIANALPQPPKAGLYAVKH